MQVVPNTYERIFAQGNSSPEDPCMEQVDCVDTFITVAPESSAISASVPQSKKTGSTVASAIFELIVNNPINSVPPT